MYLCTLCTLCTILILLKNEHIVCTLCTLCTLPTFNLIYNLTHSVSELLLCWSIFQLLVKNRMENILFSQPTAPHTQPHSSSACQQPVPLTLRVHRARSQLKTGKISQLHSTKSQTLSARDYTFILWKYSLTMFRILTMCRTNSADHLG